VKAALSLGRDRRSTMLLKRPCGQSPTENEYGGGRHIPSEAQQRGRARAFRNARGVEEGNVVTARPSCFQRVGRYRVTSDESGQSGTESAHGQESGDRRTHQDRGQESRQIPDREERQRRDRAA
jgi:hypothetical protein